MKKLGFIDYYLDEWHANNYPVWIEEYNKANGTDYKLSYAWGEIDNPNNGMTNSAWCEKFGCEQCSSIEELCKYSDHVIILAPSDPERHLDYAKRVFECGVSPYIDKTFAPDLKTAVEIFELAEKNGVKFFSSSALRYADELSGFNGDAVSAVFTGGGSNIEEYIIHQIEMAVKVLGVGASSLRYEAHADQVRIDAAYQNGKNASFFYAPCMPFTAAVSNKDGISSYSSINSQFFKKLIADIISFFETGKASFDPSETLEVMKIRDGVIRGKADQNIWISL